MLKLRILAALVVFAGYAVSAIADTDYRCLTQCVNNGKQSASCLSECSYNIAPSPTPPPSIGAAQERLEFSHKQFTAPVPVNSGTLLPPKQTNYNTPEKDYVCVAKCQQEGMQYQFCEEQCARKETSGGVLPSVSHSFTP